MTSLHVIPWFMYYPINKATRSHNSLWNSVTRIKYDNSYCTHLKLLTFDSYNYDIYGTKISSTLWTLKQYVYIINLQMLSSNMLISIMNIGNYIINLLMYIITLANSNSSEIWDSYMLQLPLYVFTYMCGL